MGRLQRICVGINFSTETDTVVKSAANLARACGAAVELVAIVKPVPPYEHSPATRKRYLVTTDTVVAGVRDRLDQLARTADFAGLPVACQVRVGSPFAELVSGARECQADVLVVGRRPGWHLERMFLGGTAERVLRKAPVPVLVVKSVLPAAVAVILAPTDFSAASRPAVAEAVALARDCKARLVLLHVIEPLAQTTLWPAEAGALALYPVEPEELAPEWEALLMPLDLRGVEWQTRAVKGIVVPTIVEVARELSADLLVSGTHGRSGFAHALLGSVAEQLVRAAECPVLTVRPEAFHFALP